MINLSLNKEPIFLKEGRKYLVIDTLYLNDIKKNMGSLNLNNLEREIRETIFPYTDTPFAKFKANKKEFTLDNIRKVSYEEVSEGDDSFFSTDTGLVILIKEKILLPFLNTYDYYELLNSLTDPINIKYWEKLTSYYNEYDIALILAPGIGSGFDFEGSGTYQVILN